MTRKLHILLIEDDPLAVELIRKSLDKAGWHYALNWVRSAEKMRESLAREAADIVLTDYSVPGYDVREELEWLSAHFPDLPVIVVTETVDEATAATCLNNGAWDYVLKSNLNRLGPAIFQALARRDEKRKQIGMEVRFRKKAEEHQLLLDHIDMHVWFQSSPHRLETVNRAFAGFWGKSKEELEGASLKVLGQHEGVQELAAGAQETVESGHDCEKDIWLTGKGKRSRLFRVKWTPVHPGTSGDDYLICTARDITELREQQLALERMEEKCRRIFENTGTATLSFFDNMIIRMCNHDVEQLTGYKREELIGKMKWDAFIHPDDLPMMSKYHRDRTQGKEAPSSYEFRLLHRDGSVKHIFMQVAVDPETRERIVSLADITPIKEYQKQLLNQEAELKAMLEYSPVAHIYEDFSGSKTMLDELARQGVTDFREYFEQHPEKKLECRGKVKIMNLNRAFLDLFGLTNREELEKRYLEIITPDSVRMFMEGLIQLYEGSHYFEKQTRYIKTDGSEVYAKTQWLTIPGHERELDLVAVTIYDMTAQILASEQEKEYQKNLKFLSDTALDVLEIDTEDDLYRHAAKSIHSLLGDCIVLVSSYDAKENHLVLRSYEGLKEPGLLEPFRTGQFPGEIRLPVVEPYLQDMKTGRLKKLDQGITDLTMKQVRGKESDELMERLNIEEVYGMGFVWGGSLYGCATILHRRGNRRFRPEILEALVKQTSIALQRVIAQKQIKTLSEAVSHSPVSVLITDPNGEIEYVNPRFCQLTGYSYDEVMGKKPAILKSGEHPEEFYANLWDTILSGKEWRGEFLNRKKNGEFFWELASISSVRNKKGEITHFVSVKEDITERKMMEEELRSAKEKAEESDQLKTAFLANLSHEIRTPMNAISGFSELISNFDIDDEARKEYTSIIKNNVNLLSALIDDIIDFSKLESGIMSIDSMECDVTSIMNELKISYLHEIRKLEKPVELIVHDTSCMKKGLYTDPLRFRQILSNLIGNAIKFTDEGSIEIGCLPEEKGMITFYVKDTGIGISEDKFNLIFERFRQADGSTTRKYGGTGLGLAISRGLVEVMGGRIWLESSPGQGSTFYFSLPYEPASDIQAAGGRKEPLAEVPDWSNFTFLVAEDNESNFLVLKAGLKDTHATILWVKTGQNAIDLCRDNEDISLVLMDVQLPDMDGLEATRAIKSAHPGMPVIAQTAYTMPEDMERIRNAGCDDHISKPIQFKLLIRKIEKFLAKFA